MKLNMMLMAISIGIFILFAGLISFNSHRHSWTVMDSHFLCVGLFFGQKVKTNIRKNPKGPDFHSLNFLSVFRAPSLSSYDDTTDSRFSKPKTKEKTVS